MPGAGLLASGHSPIAVNLRRRVHVLGATALSSYAGMAVLSYVQAPALWRHEDAPHTKAFFEGLAAWLQPVLPAPAAWLSGNPLFDSPSSVILSYWVPLAVVSTVVLALVMFLSRHGERTNADLAKLLFNWSLAFAAVCALAFPVFTQDFWLSAAWGRMIAAGLNPYYTLFTADTLTGLPLDHFPMPMSYGPLWGLVSGAVMFVAGASVLASALLFKATLAIAWIASLYLVSRITGHAAPRDRCLAIAVFGWTPVGVSQSLAEGHNDIAMVALALLWLLGLMRGWQAAPAALAASTLCKYATAPLFIIDAIHAMRSAKADWRSYVLRLTATTAFALAIMAVFYRSPQFFDGIRVVNEWHFLRPLDAVQAIELMLGLSLWPLRIAAFAVFPILAVHTVWTAWREPVFARLIQASIALMASILFAAASHVWPWYAVWGLGLAALAPTWWLSRFIIGVAVLAPFTLASWWVEPFAHHREVAALVMYGGAFAWMVFTRPGSVTKETVRETGRPLPGVEARPVDRPGFHIERTGTHG